MDVESNAGVQPLLQTSHLGMVSGLMKLLPFFLRARFSAAAVISLSSLSSDIVSRLSSTLCGQLQGPHIYPVNIIHRLYLPTVFVMWRFVIIGCTPISVSG